MGDFLMETEAYTPLPSGKYVGGTLQCPLKKSNKEPCRSTGAHYPSGSAKDAEGKRVRRWKCADCEGFFAQPS